MHHHIRAIMKSRTICDLWFVCMGRTLHIADCKRNVQPNTAEQDKMNLRISYRSVLGRVGTSKVRLRLFPVHVKGTFEKFRGLSLAVRGPGKVSPCAEG